MKLKDKSRIVCVAVTKSDKSEEKLAEELVEEEPQVVSEEPIIEAQMPTEQTDLL